MFAELYTSPARHNESPVCSAVRYATRSVLNVQGERFPQGQLLLMSFLANPYSTSSRNKYRLKGMILR